MTTSGRMKKPYGLAKVRRKRALGVYVYGWYPRLRGRSVDRRFDPVSVLVDGRHVGTCSLPKRALFVPLSPGPHHIVLVGDGVEMSCHTVQADVDKTVLEFWPTYKSLGLLPARSEAKFALKTLSEGA